MKKVSNYETPEVTVFEIHSEGTLCQSGVDGTFSVDNLNEGESGWFEE